MTNEMKFLMYLYACAAKSVSANPPDYDVNFEKLYSIADRMSLLSTLSYALKISPEIDCPDSIKSKLYAVMLGTALRNKMRTEALLELLGEIEKRGFKAAVIKGIDCARYYAKPECRISADTDLFVNTNDEEKLLIYFEQNGYTVKRRRKGDHHSKCISDKTGIIEVHTQIWQDFIDGIMIKKVKTTKDFGVDTIKVSVNGKQIRVLNQTDAMIFMTMHLIKHFILGCASIKMAYDIALYYINNRDSVDTEKYKEWIRNSGYDTIVSAIFSAMVLYCDFAENDFDNITCFNIQKGETFADSIEKYDSRDGDQCPDFVSMLRYCTTQSNIQRKGKVYSFLYNAKNVITLKFKILFPKKTHLKSSYPYLEKRPYLYLVACTHRFFTKGTRHVFHGNPKNGKILNYEENMTAQLTDVEKHHVETLKNMDLI